MKKKKMKTPPTGSTAATTAKATTNAATATTAVTASATMATGLLGWRWRYALFWRCDLRGGLCGLRLVLWVNGKLVVEHQGSVREQRLIMAQLVKWRCLRLMQKQGEEPLHTGFRGVAEVAGRQRVVELPGLMC
jgi:hypothetical protein